MSRDEELDRAFEEIVSHVRFDEPEVPGDEEPPTDPAPEPDLARLARTFGRTAWSDPLDTEASWEDEGHFVPPDPGPPPAMEPVRRAAWLALLGSPVLIVLLALARLAVPPWVFGGLGLVFVTAFVYLVATMRRGDDDGWSGDDGAVL
jgi:hypothetical protein